MTKIAPAQVDLMAGRDPGSFNPQRHMLQQDLTLPHLVLQATQAQTAAQLRGEPVFMMALGERYACYQVDLFDNGRGTLSLTQLTSIGGEPLFNNHLYLFNVIVALEWQPSPRTLQQLVAGFQTASNLLYDVTDGQMAFGQVVFGDLELMDVADIQITASNRCHPRSWVNGLNEEAKYTPIRLGRGIWHKNYNVLIPWNEPDASHAIVHEWAHYALGLLDDYLDEHRPYIQDPSRPDRLVDDKQARARGLTLLPSSPELVVPLLNLAAESILATLEGPSEIVPLGQAARASRRQTIGQQISRYYPTVNLSRQVLEGPHQLPIELPQFPELQQNGISFFSPPAEEWLIPASVVQGINLEHCWLYVLRPGAGGSGQPWDRIIAQGTLDKRAQFDGFWLFGAQDGDELLVLGNAQNTTNLQVKRGTLRVADATRREMSVALTNVAPPSPWPVVTVIPHVPGSTGMTQIPQIKVRITDATMTRPDDVWIFHLGQQSGTGQSPTRLGLARNGSHWESGFIDVPHLDGQVLLHWRASGQLLIYDYSQGGGPNSHVRAPDYPITAGSSDGNAMFFFHKTDPNLDYSDIRVVTTRNYGGFELSEPGKPRSYLFSAASTRPLPVDELSPTLVLHFDKEASGSQGELFIHRYNPQTLAWDRQNTYLPSGGYYAATPLGADADVGFYRLFLV